MSALNFHPYYPDQDPSHRPSMKFTAITPTNQRATIPSAISAHTPAPKSHRSAQKYPDAIEWAEAHDAELQKLDNMQAIKWTPRHLIPPNAKPIPLTMTYRYKRDNNDKIIERKARCAVRGNMMLPHTLFDPATTATFTADKTTIRLLLCHASAHRIPIEHFDITSAYLHEPFSHKTPVFIKQHPLFDGSLKHPEPAGTLERNLYGTRQGGRIFCDGARDFLTTHNFTQLKSDPCCFTKFTPTGYIFVAMTIDDFLACATHQPLLDELHQTLCTKYSVKRLGFPSRYLNWHITQTPQGVHIAQPHIIRSVVSKTNMTDAKPIERLYSDGIDLSPPGPDEPQDDTIRTTYREVIGELRYLTDCTRPELQFFINALARASHKPTQRHWKHLKRLIRFLKHTPSLGISTPHDDPLISYADADFANDKTTRKSISGTLYLLHGSPIHWASQRQSLVALSTCDVEFISISDTIRQTNWIAGLLKELRIIPQQHAITTYTDSQSALQIATQTAPTKRHDANS